MALAAAGGDAPYRAARLTAAQLRAAGVNFDLAPVLDVNSNPLNPVIGVRSFGDLPEEAAERAMGFMRGLLDGGVMACGKHFPGHGDTDTDSHIGLPRVDKSREQLEECELLPFRWGIARFSQGCANSRTSQASSAANGVPALPTVMARRFGGGCAVCSDDPDSEEIAAIARKARNASCIVLNTSGALRNSGQLILMLTLGKLKSPCSS